MSLSRIGVILPLPAGPQVGKRGPNSPVGQVQITLRVDRAFGSAPFLLSAMLFAAVIQEARSLRRTLDGWSIYSDDLAVVKRKDATLSALDTEIPFKLKPFAKQRAARAAGNETVIRQ